MPNGKPPKTTGEHLVSLYGYVQGFKRQIDHLHQDVGKLEKKTDTVIYWIIGGAFTTILTLVGLFNLFINFLFKIFEPSLIAKLIFIYYFKLLRLSSCACRVKDSIISSNTSPSKNSSNLWRVKFILWSVTLPWGKL